MEKWYGYQHINGSVHVKRYLNYDDLLEVIQSPFVQYITQVFEAKDRKEALVKTKEFLNEK